jgi:2-C-methyl-D-erythritol 2,4-cyclodiphosphate synthase
MKSALPNYRVGIGYDVHRLSEGRRLVLGGVEIPSPLGLDGHSDADVLCHAVTDAILGALGRGDIGRHFPDTDSSFKDADSRDLLRRIWESEAKPSGWRIVNVDTVLIAEAPRLAPHLPRMCENLASILECDPSRVSVKATTHERIGGLGRGEGIAAQAVVLLVSEIT